MRGSSLSEPEGSGGHTALAPVLPDADPVAPVVPPVGHESSS
nr:MAG TPA: hypothetical protein [Caudoviricetes sp.]